MKKKTRHGLRRQLMRTTILGLSMLSLSIVAEAQSSNNWVFYEAPFPTNPVDLDEVKGYTTAVIPSGATNDESVMAGTTYGPTATGVYVPNFFRVDGNGIINAVSNRTYDDVRYVDERAMDVELQNDATYDHAFITCWARPVHPNYMPIYVPTPPPYVTNNDRDHIKVLAVDNNNPLTYGNLVGEINICDNSPLPPGQAYGNSLYPMNSLFLEVSGEKRLYICGYFTPDDTRCPGCPGIILNNLSVIQSTNNKRAFLTYVNVTDPANMTQGPMVYFNTAPTQNTSNVDFDIALRLKEYDGNIMMTGSVNAQTGALNNGFVRSGTMMLRIDPVSMAVINDISFVTAGNQDGYGNNEYGMGIEVRTPLSGTPSGVARIYAISNVYDINNPTGEDPKVGMDQKPSQLAVSLVNDSISGGMGFYGQRQESVTGHWWFTNTLQEGTPDSGKHKILAAGFIDYTPPGETMINAASTTNVNPFLMDLNIDPILSFGTNYNPVYMTVFENQSGTNVFNTLGGSFHNMYFHTAFADRDDNGDDIVFNAPKWGDPSYNSLGLKIIHAIEQVQANTTVGPNYGNSHFNSQNITRTYNIPDCGENDMKVDFNEAYLEAALPVIDSFPQVFNEAPFSSATTFIAGNYGDCNSSSPNQYKPGSLTAEAEEKVGVYPNPVSDILNISNAEGAKYIVMDVTGRAISTGTLSSTQATINVGSLANGMYILHLTKGNVVNKVKFVKQ